MAKAKGTKSAKASKEVKEVKKAKEVKKPAALKVEAPAAGDYVPRLKDRYSKAVLPKLMEQFGYKNRFRVPRISKVIVNIGMGKAVQNPKLLDAAVKELAQIAGQQPVVTTAKKSIASFKIRAGMPIGCRVTLRGNRMYEFLDRFCSVALPRIRDFRGVSPKSFDGRGNYTIGIKEQLIFPEIRFDQIAEPHGMDITVVTTAASNPEAKALLELLGMPFRTA
jgi:large subunit ribosomal protein L5